MSTRRSISFPSRPPLDHTDAIETRGDARLGRLARTIEAEIVPRLLISFASVNRARALQALDAQPTAADVTELARLLLAPESSMADAYIEVVRQHGTSRERICTQLLAPAARRLGELWEHEECDFAELAAGLCRLESALRELSALPAKAEKPAPVP